jgi:hypothetical protein
MKASELRINNWIQFRHTETPVRITLGDFVREYNDEHLEDYEPIPLTEEWLLKFGFDSVKTWYEINDQFISLKPEYDGCGGFDFFVFTIDMDRPMYVTFIEYVHQLQNLYFAITGQELNLNKEDENK